MQKYECPLLQAKLCCHPTSPPNLYVEAVTPSTQNVTAFGDRAFKEVIMLK